MYILALTSPLFTKYTIHNACRHIPYGQKFAKSAHERCVVYAISANFDADRRKKTDNFKNRIRFRCTAVVKLSCLRLSGTDIGTQQ